MAGPKLPDLQTLIQAGINPKNGLPYKFSLDSETLTDDIKRVLRIIDQQDAVNRFHWYNLPDGLDGELLERILYYRGQGMFFYVDAEEKFYFLPFALNGSIDVYGRFTQVTPVPFNGTANDGKPQKPWIEGLVRKPQYSLLLDETTWDDITDKCVLLYDYSKQISQTTLPRQVLNEPILGTMAECIPFMRTSMILGTGVQGFRVNDADQAEQVDVAAKSVERAAKTGKPWIPIIGGIDFQQLTDASNLKGADYMQAMQSLDNFRLSTYGIENGGLFEKKAHELETEAAINGGNVGLVFQDSLRIRQHFCDVVNSIWGLGIWCEPSESVMGGDVNHDGVGYDVADPATEGGEMGGSEDDSTI